MMGETGLLGFRIANIEQGAGLYFIYNLTLLFFLFLCVPHFQPKRQFWRIDKCIFVRECWGRGVVIYMWQIKQMGPILSVGQYFQFRNWVPFHKLFIERGAYIIVSSPQIIDIPRYQNTQECKSWSLCSAYRDRSQYVSQDLTRRTAPPPNIFTLITEHSERFWP